MGVIRSVGLIAPKGTGKTSLAEAILFNAKVIKRLGRVGTATRRWTSIRRRSTGA